MPHREATRFLSASQPCAGSWLDAGLTDTRIRQHNESPAFLTAEQRRLGLYLTTVVLAGLPGALGDTYANAGEHTTRHNAAMYGWRDAEQEVASGPVVIGDKTPHSRRRLTVSAIQYYARFNSGHIPDVIVPEGGRGGRHLLLEIKVYTPLKLVHNVGHTHAFGNTEEDLRVKILGCKEVGNASHGRFDHKTGRGHIKGQVGHYSDALSKGSTVIPVIMEPLGGLCPHALAHLRHLAWRASKITTASTDKVSAQHSFLTKHTQRIVTGVVMTDAAHINDMITKAASRDSVPPATVPVA